MPEKKRITLDNLEKKALFTVPEGYFEQLPQRVSNRVPAAKKERVLVPVWLKYSVGVAATVLVAVLGYWFYPAHSNQPADPSLALAAVPEKEIIEYLNTRTDVSTHEWIEAASRAEVQVNHQWLETPDEQTLLDEINPAALEEAL